MKVTLGEPDSQLYRPVICDGVAVGTVYPGNDRMYRIGWFMVFSNSEPDLKREIKELAEHEVALLNVTKRLTA